MTGALPARRLEDTDQWVNRMEINSGSSSRKYIVAEKVVGGVPSGTWGCNCPGWKGYGRCKHLTTMGLTSCRKPSRPAPRGLGSGHNAAFTDAAYRHYDTSGGYGTPDEWIAAAEAAAGNGTYIPPAAARGGGRRVTPDMRLLGLDEMPAEAAGLVRAMRKRARVLHPDVVHPTDASHRHCPECDAANVPFAAMTQAYDRLLRRYQ